MTIVPQSPSTKTPASPTLLNELESEVSVEAAPLLQFIVRHAAIIVGILVLLILALIGTGAYNWYSNNAAQQAQSDLTRLVLKTQGAERVKALEGFIATAPASIRAGAWLALADAALAEQDFIKAAQAFGQVTSLDANGAAGLLAALNQGQTLLKAGQAAQALEVLEKLEGLMPEKQRTIVRTSIAEAATQAGKPQRARMAFDALAAASAGAEAEYFRFRSRSLEAAATTDTPTQ